MSIMDSMGPMEQWMAFAIGCMMLLWYSIQMVKLTRGGLQHRKRRKLINAFIDDKKSQGEEYIGVEFTIEELKEKYDK